MTCQKLLDFAKSEGIVLRENEPLRDHTTFRVGGPARLFALPRDTYQLIALLVFARGHDLKWAVIGNGSNLLVPTKAMTAW